MFLERAAAGTTTVSLIPAAHLKSGLRKFQGTKKSQNEGQENEGEAAKELGGNPPLAVLMSPGPPGLPSGSSWAAWPSILILSLS